jgi:hypothetical protein
LKREGGESEKGRRKREQQFWGGAWTLGARSLKKG